MLKFIFAGTTGISKNTACDELLKLSALDNEININIIHLEELLKENGGFDDITQYLNSYNWDIQKRAWEAAFQDVLTIVESNDCDVAILCMHFIYYRNSQYFSPININYIEKYEPNGIITFIDDIFLIKKRIMNRNEKSPFQTIVRLDDLIAWRSIEIHEADMLCSFLRKERSISNYVMSIKQPAITLLNLILNPDVLKLYIAHPITSVKAEQKLVDEVEGFKKQLHREFTVFDPTTIDERLLTQSLLDQYPEWEKMSKGDLAESNVILEYDNRWPINHEPILCEGVKDLFPIEIPADEIIEVREAIDHQIQSRDYRLISQSDVMVAYRPNIKGKISTGVLSEMHYARDVAFKTCYTFFPEEDGKQEASPFRGGGNYYQNIESLLTDLRSYTKRKR